MSSIDLIQVRVPYRVVGLVVGPKGATIKRIQQQTRTYIVTPSRDKEPVFEVTGLPENVETARKEIEAHIAFRYLIVFYLRFIAFILTIIDYLTTPKIHISHEIILIPELNSSKQLVETLPMVEEIFMEI